MSGIIQAQQAAKGVVDDNVAGSFEQGRLMAETFEGQVSLLGLVEQQLFLADMPV